MSETQTGTDSLGDQSSQGKHRGEAAPSEESEGHAHGKHRRSAQNTERDT